MIDEVDSSQATKPTTRSHVMRFRVTSDELKRYQDDSIERGFKSISDYFRWALGSENLSDRVTPAPRKKKRIAPEREINPELLYAIHRIGSNLNQIAKALNTANLIDEEVSSKALLLALLSIESQLEKMIEQNEAVSDEIVQKIKDELLVLLPPERKKRKEQDHNDD